MKKQKITLEDIEKFLADYDEVALRAPSEIFFKIGDVAGLKYLPSNSLLNLAVKLVELLIEDDKRLNN